MSTSPKLLIMILIFISGAICGCRGYSITGGPGKINPPSLKAESEQSRELLSINSLLIAGVELDERLRDRADARGEFDEQLRSAAREELGLKVLFVDEVGVKQGTRRDEYRAIASKRAVDGILFTRINNFVVRTGSSIGAEQPASVDFHMQIVRARDGVTVWHSTYHHKDEPLSENLFKIEQHLKNKEGRGYQTAQQLLSKGYRSALSDFSNRRLAQFSSKG